MNTLLRARSARNTPWLLAVGICSLPLLASCGSSGNGGGSNSILGDLATDLVISQNTTASEIRAKNLTINDGVTVTSSGDMKIQTAAKVTLNGILTPGGGLTVISKSGMDAGANARVTGLKGNVIMVDDASLIPTEAQMDTLFDQPQDLVLGGPRDRSVSRSRQGVSWRLIPHEFGPNAAGYHIWVNVGADIKIGRAGGNYVQNMDPGKSGSNAPAPGGDPSQPIGGNGRTGGSIEVTGDSIEFNGNVTFTLGNGGPGGNATATGCVITAKGGKGGKCGTGHFTGDNGVNNNGTITVNYGHGGDGGTATASSDSFAGQASCPAKFCAGPATAIGGQGGDGPGSQAAKANTTGAGNVTVNGAPGGNGGAATATGGVGGTSTCCPAGAGGLGGKAVATGGAGGPSKGSAGSGFNVAGGFTGGNGGDATSNGGKGGAGASCCNPPMPGGPGGKGGDATATVGVGGTGTSGNGNIGNAAGAAGDGGKGGDGTGPGAGGPGGTGAQVPNGAPGVAGGPCPAGGCTQETEPNDSEGTATPLPAPAGVEQSTSGCGSLNGAGDKDHFLARLNTGTYRLQVTQIPPGGAGLYLHVGNNAATNPPINNAATFTVNGTNVSVYIGFFSGNGAYTFTLTRTQ